MVKWKTRTQWGNGRKNFDQVDTAEAEAALDAVMLAWYKVQPVECARYCDEVFDRSGAYLGELRKRGR